MSLVINVFETIRQEMDGLVQFPIPDNDQDDFWLRSQKLYIECLTRLLSREEREDLIRQLVHFLAACTKADLIPLDVLWDTPPYARYFQEKFAGYSATSESGLVSQMQNGSKFVVYWNAMPGLSACAQLLYFTNGQVDFREILTNIEDEPESFDSLERVMRLWADGFDRYRQNKGGSSQGDKRYRAVRTFLSESLAGEGYTCTEITARQVIDFWSEHWDQSGLAMKTYKTNHEVFTDFCVAYASELKAFSVEGATAVDDVYTATDSSTALQSHPTFGPWTNLTSTKPSHVKLLKGKQWQVLEVIGAVEPAAHGLRRSALIAHCFAEINNKVGRASADDRAAMYEGLRSSGFEPSYASIRDVALQVLPDFEKAIWASAHILVSNGAPEGVALLAQLDDKIGSYLEHFAKGLSDVDDSNFQQRLISSFFQQVGPLKEFPQDIDQPMQRTLSCWKDMKLQGFGAKDLEDPDVVEELSELALDMASALEHAKASVRFLVETCKDNEIQKHDERAIHDVLVKVYGDDEALGVSHG